MNRYSYVTNNPLRYTDPTGHMVAEDKDSGLGVNGYKYVIENKFKWHLKGEWSQEEVKTIYQTGNDIATYVNGLTGGSGLGWMNEYLGGTTIKHWSGSYNQTLPGWVPTIGENTISLVKGGYDAHWFAHELGHIWDINSGQGICACGAIGGVGDALNTFIGGHIASTRSSRYDNYPGKPADPNIQSATVMGMVELLQFDPGVAGGYGNGSTADYLAESFSWNVIDRKNTPIIAGLWVDQAIIAEAASLP